MSNSQSDVTPNENPEILVVEDDEALAEAMAVWLGAEYDVTTATDAATARASVHDGLDAILLDRNLPDASGGDVLRAIRDDGYTVPVAMVTGVEPDADDAALPFDDYLVKPATRSDLTDLVERLRRRGRYDDAFRDYYALVTKRATLRTSNADGELAASTDYRELETRIAERERRLDDAVTAIDEHDDVAAIFEKLS
ncbi:HalX domain-containing protein [Halocalculus aciditolerans]|uniref:DNA-binding protein n=1 Tax=Halocalculus aciditolerans TaxID=1383812 RepID=A0A830F9P9_9EURY|nr:HalX domain-containing protein [Halocalculus aciditolerans]GGL53857.1 DNA-binding protein [Halocalculus aciditolerans]